MATDSPGSSYSAETSSTNLGLAKKRKVRGGHKAYLKRAIGNTRICLDTQPPDVLSLRQNKLLLEEKLKTIKDIDDQILELVDDEEEIEKEIDEAGLFRENVRTTLLEIEEKLKSLEIREITESRTTHGGANTAAHGGASFTKLPRLQLRKYYGKPHKWQEFWDSFKASVDSNPSLSNCLKLEYLKAQCEGEAYQSVAGLELTDHNYGIAIELLKRRFGQRQIILNSHVDTLLKVNPVRKHADTTELRKFFDLIETHNRGLQSLGVDPQTYGTVLVNVLLQKLPEDIQLIISRKMSETLENEDWDLTNMLHILKQEIEAREKCSPVRREPSRHVQDNYATGAALFSGARFKQSSQHCTFCHGNHVTAGCHVVTNIQERRNILRRNGRCFLCLRKSGHLAKDCDASIKCFNCRGNHHVALCDKGKSGTYQGKVENSFRRGSNANICRQTPENVQSSGTFCGVNTEESTAKGILLQTAFVVAKNPQDPSRKVKLRVILDSGSQRSYISEKARNTLDLASKKRENMVIKVFGSTEGKETSCDIVAVDLSGRNSNFNVEINALVVPTICSPIQGQTIRFAKKMYPHLQNLHLADFPNENETDLKVDVLLGSDTIWRVFTGEFVKGESIEDPVAVGTNFGWVLSGVVTDIPRNLLSSVNLATTHILRVDCNSLIVSEETVEISKFEKEPTKRIEELFELETLGINDIETVEEQFISELKYDEDHYTVSLPWREHHDILPDNYELSVARLNSTLKRLRKEPELLKEYNNVIEEQLKRGIIEEVKPNLLEPAEVGRIHYLSHHAVVRKDATTTKVRVVMDGSAKINAESPSLNECLHTGPSLTPNVLDILLRFRSYKVALISDVEKAFHMIRVSKGDRDVLRFLWINDIDSENPEIVIYRYTRVVFGLNCSPFLLGATLSHHVSNYEFENPKVGEKLKQSLYVDDVVFGAETPAEVYELYKETKLCLSKGSFHLHKFQCSDRETQKLIESENDQKHEPKVIEQNQEKEYPKTILGDNSTLRNTETKVLGMKWDYENDQILLNFEHFVNLSRQLLPTKRNLLKLAAFVFDPIGFVSPVIVRIKVLLQEICKLNLKWDDALPENLNHVWMEIITDLEQVIQIRIPRNYFHANSGGINDIHLHGFCDASTKAYCAVIYIILRNDNGSEIKLVTSKSRVAPLKCLTIPRLELMAALILARLMETTKRALESRISINSVTYWSDSTIVLSWIKNNRNYKQFVSHRVKEILKLTKPSEWNHCPTKENPADIGSREQSWSQPSENELWWSGPVWVQGQEEGFPKQCVKSNIQ